jgi:hypothetical protein
MFPIFALTKRNSRDAITFAELPRSCLVHASYINRQPVCRTAFCLGGLCLLSTIADISSPPDTAIMTWWDWKTKQHLALIAGMLAVAATPWLALGWLTKDGRALLGGTAFLFIPQIVAWALFVGLTTGRIPSAYGRSELRAQSPTWFWLTAVVYAAILLLFLWIISGVVMGGTIWGF